MYLFVFLKKHSFRIKSLEWICWGWVIVKAVYLPESCAGSGQKK
jgi:hypothetical protein